MRQTPRLKVGMIPAAAAGLICSAALCPSARADDPYGGPTCVSINQDKPDAAYPQEPDCTDNLQGGRIDISWRQAYLEIKRGFFLADPSGADAMMEKLERKAAKKQLIKNDARTALADWNQAAAEDNRQLRHANPGWQCYCGLSQLKPLKMLLQDVHHFVHAPPRPGETQVQYERDIAGSARALFDFRDGDIPPIIRRYLMLHAPAAAPGPGWAPGARRGLTTAEWNSQSAERQAQSLGAAQKRIGPSAQNMAAALGAGTGGTGAELPAGDPTGRYAPFPGMPGTQGYSTPGNPLARLDTVPKPLTPEGGSVNSPAGQLWQEKVLDPLRQTTDPVTAREADASAQDIYQADQCSSSLRGDLCKGWNWTKAYAHSESAGVWCAFGLHAQCAKPLLAAGILAGTMGADAPQAGALLMESGSGAAGAGVEGALIPEEAPGAVSQFLGASGKISQSNIYGGAVGQIAQDPTNPDTYNGVGEQMMKTAAASIVPGAKPAIQAVGAINNANQLTSLPNSIDSSDSSDDNQ